MTSEVPYLWHRSPTVSCSWDPCKHLRRDLESSWAENRTLCTRTNQFPVEHDIKDKCITNTYHITDRACNTDQASWYMADSCDDTHALDGKLIPVHEGCRILLNASVMVAFACMLWITETSGSFLMGEFGHFKQTEPNNWNTINYFSDQVQTKTCLFSLAVVVYVDLIELVFQLE